MEGAEVGRGGREGCWTVRVSEGGLEIKRVRGGMMDVTLDRKPKKTEPQKVGQSKGGGEER